MTLVVMWIFATAVTLGPGLRLLDAQVMVDNVARPGNALLVEIQRERKLTVAYLAGGGREPAELTGQRLRTDAAVTEFRRLAGAADARDAASPNTARRLAEFDADLGSIESLRDEVNRGEIDRPGAMRRYTQVIDSAFAVFGSLIRATDEELTRQSQAILQISRAVELLAQEDAVIVGALVDGTANSADLGQAIQLIGAQRFLFSATLADLYVTDQQDYQRLLRTEAFLRLAELEDTIITDGRAGAALPVDPVSWSDAYDGVATQLRDFELRIADAIVERSRPTALLLFGRIAVAGLLGLVAVVVTVVASARIARSLIKRLAGLRQAALELAIDRLPQVVSRLRRGEPVDVAQEAPPLPYGDDEIGQVGHAFNELQRTAIASAVDEANVRHGLNEVFLNIARRSQTLLHRQLAILDAMERRTDNPVELEDLFRVDHLATRMRRHAEDLVILAGAAPGRGWRNPVAMIDVVRGAVSEVEDYARVGIRPLPEIGLTGRAVGDVIHLLAELIENATSFSPPHTRVSVGGDFVANGFAIEIEDRGLGLSPVAIAALNQRLAARPDFDVTDSAQLGLFVVGRLAHRHGVKVQLRSSAYGGVTAVALIPDELIVSGDFTTRASAARPRQAVAALPASPAAPPNGLSGPRGESNGATRSGPHQDASGEPARGWAGQPSTAGPGAGSGAAAVAASATPAVAVPEAPAVTAPPSSTRAKSASSRSTTTRATKPKPRHARSDVIEPPASAGADALPRRVRQTSLAPQLRDDPAATTGDIPTQAAPARSPEQMRAMMSSFQAGTARGRRDADTGQDLDGSARERDPQ